MKEIESKLEELGELYSAENMDDCDPKKVEERRADLVALIDAKQNLLDQLQRLLQP